MANETTYSAIFGAAQRLHAPLETSVRDVPHLEAGRLRLGDALGRAQGLLTQQATPTAAKQDLSQQLKTTIEDVQFLPAIVREGVRHFGASTNR